ncbi:hypothetical protein BKI52_09630 [marine bacterium AO1-C]|nr:hypothetical protein BKI52_09630 [marine bacterium AO1-C]
MRKYISLLAIITTLWTTGCQQNQDTSTPNTNVQLSFANEFGGQPLQLNTLYSTLLNDQLTLTTFNYYVSNIQLKKADGTTWKQEESYHLYKTDDQNNGQFSINLQDVPQGQYTELTFSIGIDPLRNSSGAQEGALDPVNGMFWTWKTGYMFVKSEGFYYQNGQKQGAWVYHTGDDASYQTITLSLNNVTLNSSSNQIAVKADVQKMFGGFTGDATQLKAPTDGSSVSIRGGAQSVLISQNYRQMFSLGSSSQ